MHFPQFFTATILNWNLLLQDDAFKDIIMDAIRFRVKKKQVRVYGFVIMPNHIHTIWQIHDSLRQSDFQRDLLKFIAREMISSLRADKKEEILKQHTVYGADRTIQVWERNSLSIDIYSYEVFMQKLNYIHNNPLQEKWKLSETASGYKYSSARFYETGIDEFDILTRYVNYR